MQSCLGGYSMRKNPILKEILTPEELAEVNELRCDLLKSVTNMERKYYDKEIHKIFNRAKERYFNSQADITTAK